MRLFYLLLICFAFSPQLAQSQTVGHTSTGLASYFSDEFQGSVTKYGATYNRNEMVAAHKMYPYNSKVQVTNLENGKSVVVTIIDQGPFIQGRIIEVSYRAAEQLSMLSQNTTRVEIKLLSTPSQPAVAGSTATNAPTTATRQRDEAPRVSPPPAPATTPAPRPATSPPTTSNTPTPAANTPRQAERVVSTPTPPPPARTTTPTATPTRPADQPAVTFQRAANDPITTGNFGPGVYKIELRKAGEGNFGVQVASLKSLESALTEVAKFQAKWFDNILVKRVETSDGPIFKIILGPFPSLSAAQQYAKDLERKYKIKGFSTSLN